MGIGVLTEEIIGGHDFDIRYAVGTLGSTPARYSMSSKHARSFSSSVGLALYIPSIALRTCDDDVWNSLTLS